MPQKPERKREYMRRYMRKRRHSPGGESERGRGTNKIPPYTPGVVSPSRWRLRAYDGVDLASVPPEHRGAVVRRANAKVAWLVNVFGQYGHEECFRRDVEQLQRITQLEADLARLEAMVDSMLREDAL